MDFNGVIIDDEGVQMRAYQEVLKGEGIDLTEEDYYSSLGMDDRTFTVAAFERADKTAENGKIDKIIEYCKQDVAITRDLFLFGEEKGFVKYKTRAGKIEELKVDWKAANLI